MTRDPKLAELPRAVQAAAHEPSSGFCGVCGAVWPCGAARRASADDRTVPYGLPLSSLSGGAGGCGGRRRSRHPGAGDGASGGGRPVALGYVRLVPGVSAVPVAAGMAGMEVFAGLQGWRLGDVFVDDQPGRPTVAWSSVMVAARTTQVAAVLVPDVAGLRPETLTMERLRAQCAREVGVPLLMAPPTPGVAGWGW